MTPRYRKRRQRRNKLKRWERWCLQRLGKHRSECSGYEIGMAIYSDGILHTLPRSDIFTIATEWTERDAKYTWDPVAKFWRLKRLAA